MNEAKDELLGDLSPAFRPPPLDLALGTHEIHIWCADLDQPGSQFHRFGQTLSIDERMRAEQFHFQEDRKRFIVRHGILRMIVGFYLGVKPSELQFYHGKNGKPALTDTLSKKTICFNLSHSQGFALYGFSREHEIGVDIERVREIPEMEQIAERFFSVTENVLFRALPERKKKETFFQIWTRKEAFLKATGDGLSRPLDNFDVQTGLFESFGIGDLGGDSGKVLPCWIRSLNSVPNFACAFAVRGTQLQIKCFKAVCN